MNHSSGLCITSVDDLCTAVAYLSKNHGDTSTNPQKLSSASETVAVALRELGSGLLAAEKPDCTEAVIRLAFSVLSNQDVSRAFDWNKLSDSHVAAGLVAFLARRAVRILLNAVEHGHHSYGRPHISAGKAVPLLLGVIGDVRQHICAITALALRDGFEHNVLFQCDSITDLVFVCVATIKLPLVAQHLDNNDPLKAAACNLMREMQETSTQLLNMISQATEKALGSLSYLISQVWSKERSALHQYIVSAREAEDKAFDFESLLARQCLLPSSKIVQELALNICETEDLDVCLSHVLAAALPLVEDTSQDRRLDGLRVIAHCVRTCSMNKLKYHAEAILIALKDSLLLRDCETSSACFPVLYTVMTVVEPMPLIGTDPPKVCMDAWKAALSSFIAHVNHTGNDTTALNANTAEEHLMTAVFIAKYIHLMTKSRILSDLKIVMIAMETLLVRVGHMVGINGNESLVMFISTKNAFVEVIRYSWPRVPVYFHIVLRAAFSAVLSSKPCTDAVVCEAVAAASTDLVIWASRCVPRSQAERYLDVITPLCDNKPSLNAAANLIVQIRTKLDLVENSVSSHDTRTCAGKLAAKYF